MDLLTYLSVVLAIFIAFCGFTTLYGKGNPLYSWAEFSYLATATAMSVMWSWTATFGVRYAIQGLIRGELIWVPAIILGILMWFRVYPKYSYLSRVSIAFTMGIALGWGLRTSIFTSFIRQISATIVNLWVPEYGIMYFIARTTIAVSIITMMSFFIYTTEIKGPHLWSATIGEYIMYTAFGAVFAQTFMGRLSLFVGHMQDYMFPVWKQPYTIGAALLVFVILLALDKKGLAQKLAAA